MTVLIDTCIWSDALRKPLKDSRQTQLLKRLIEEQRIVLIGPIRQEILSGIKHKTQFDRLKGYLRAFPDLVLDVSHYELAASFFNSCRAKGVQGSNTDFLICAVSHLEKVKIFTNDGDFRLYKKVIEVDLLEWEDET